MTDQLRLSKTLAYALRHRPDEFDLQLDAGGWVSIEDLLVALQRRHSLADVTRDDLEALIVTSERQRFELEGDRIRARYGHSLPGRIELTAAPPPAHLYHSASPEQAAQILEEGLQPMGRQYVHLSLDAATAREVGLRHHPDPVTIEVDAAAASQAGVQFYPAGDELRLADAVPPDYLRELPPDA